jgi:hypothetical protein
MSQIEQTLIAQIRLVEKEASVGCGLYYELYVLRILDAFRLIAAELDDRGKKVFSRLLTVHGWDISDETYLAACHAQNKAWSEISSDFVN